MFRRAFFSLTAFVAALWSPAAQTEDYPTRPITIIVAYAPGGTFDVIARIIAPRMGELLGQPIIVENVTGAEGIVGVNRRVNARPDGYTVLLGTTGTHAYNQTIYRKRHYDALRDFTPVTLFSEQPMLLEVRKDLPAKNLPEFIDLVKRNAAKMQFGSAGVGSTTHMACALLNARIGVNVTHVPYRGSAPAANDLVAGQIDYLCGNLGAAVGRIAGGHERALAVFSPRRSELMPDLPTADEQGLKDFEVTTWTAFFLPKNASKAIVDRLNEATHSAMETAALKQRMRDIGVVGVAPERRSADYLAKFVADEIARWEGPIKAAGLQQD